MIDKAQSTVSIQIEKKCFFFKTEEIYSSCQKCCFWYYQNKNSSANAQFIEVYDKYPKCIQFSILPLLVDLEAINKDKGNKMDTAAIKSELVRNNSEKKSWLTKSISDLRLPFQRDRLNRVVDESSINSIHVGQSLD